MAAAEGGTVTVFIEYRIDSSHRESFLHHVGAILEETAQIAAVKEHEIMEGTDQPGLFVEVIRVGDSDSAQRILRYRREPQGGVLRKLNGWISGKGIQGWAFCRINGSL
ncbi:MAG: hypothetical protein ACOYEF_03235 [Planifilum sp.]|jgi:hypothetical protein